MNKIRENLKNGEDSFDLFDDSTTIVDKTDEELLEEAIKNEDYEEAAKLRDKINK